MNNEIDTCDTTSIQINDDINTSDTMKDDIDTCDTTSVSGMYSYRYDQPSTEDGFVQIYNVTAESKLRTINRI